MEGVNGWGVKIERKQGLFKQGHFIAIIINYVIQIRF